MLSPWPHVPHSVGPSRYFETKCDVEYEASLAVVPFLHDLGYSSSAVLSKSLSISPSVWECIKCDSVPLIARGLSIDSNGKLVENDGLAWFHLSSSRVLAISSWLIQFLYDSFPSLFYVTRRDWLKTTQYIQKQIYGSVTNSDIYLLIF